MPPLKQDRLCGYKVLRPDFTSPWAPSPVRYCRGTWTYAKDSAHPLYVFTNLQKALNYISDDEADGLIIYACEYEQFPRCHDGINVPRGTARASIVKLGEYVGRKYVKRNKNSRS